MPMPAIDDSSHDADRIRWERYRDAIARVGDGFFVLGPDLRLVEVNAALCRMFGRTAEELLGRSPLEFIAESSRPLMRRMMQRIGDSEVRHTHYEGLRRDGTTFPILVRAMTHRNPRGDVESSVGFVTDLTEIVRAQQTLAESERELRAILDNMQDTYYRTDVDGVVVRASRSMQRLLGYAPEEVVGRNLAEFYFAPEARAKFLADLKANGGAVVNYEARLRHRLGHEVWVSTNAHFYHDERGRIAGVEGTARDITDLRRAREELRLAGHVFRAASEAIVVTDPQLAVLSVNPAFVEILGVAAEQATGRSLFSFVAVQGEAGGAEAVRLALATRGQWSGEVWGRRRDGSGFPCWLSLSAVRDDAAAMTHAVAIVSDITERKASLARIEFLAHHDPLTLLPNRLLLRDRVEQSISRCARAGTMLALLFIDLDSFKRINDTLGHATGDVVLREVARRLAAAVRETDTVCRYGGDEFVIVLTDLTDAGHVPEIARKVLQEVAAPIRLPVGEVFVRCSVGAALYPQDGDDLEALMERADAAMYAAKRAEDPGARR
ncbi:MAG: PAS domain S-box protein [Burkholderiaceae bacterium]|nr:PAS domain S-box protein [Burkholderiaceae bacterium]